MAAPASLSKRVSRRWSTVRSRSACASAVARRRIGMFARQWYGKVDEVVVVDDHITGVLSEHQAGKLLGAGDTGIKMKGRRSTPGRYFHVAKPGTGWGGADISDPLEIVAGFDPSKVAWPAWTMLMVSTTGEQHAFYRLDESLEPVESAAAGESAAFRSERNPRDCEPACAQCCSWAVPAARWRAGAPRNSRAPDPLGAPGVDPRQLRRAPVSSGRGRHHLHGRCPLLPDNGFGYLPTPAIVAPIESPCGSTTMPALGGHIDHVRPLCDILAQRTKATRGEQRRRQYRHGAQRESVTAAEPP